MRDGNSRHRGVCLYSPALFLRLLLGPHNKDWMQGKRPEKVPFDGANLKKVIWPATAKGKVPITSSSLDPTFLQKKKKKKKKKKIFMFHWGSKCPHKTKHRYKTELAAMLRRGKYIKMFYLQKPTYIELT